MGRAGRAAPLPPSGKRKRKKKVYTTKKKNKHIHKKIKMGIYRLYSVDGKGWARQARDK